MNHMNSRSKKQRGNESKLKSINNDKTAHESYKMPLWFIQSRNAIYYILGVIEILLAFRFVFRILGANSQNAFVSFLYSAASFFAAPFSGIFNSFVPYGLAAKSVFEPAVIIGMAVYAVIAWGLVGLLSMKL